MGNKSSSKKGRIYAEIVFSVLISFMGLIWLFRVYGELSSNNVNFLLEQQLILPIIWGLGFTIAGISLVYFSLKKLKNK